MAAFVNSPIAVAAKPRGPRTALTATAIPPIAGVAAAAPSPAPLAPAPKPNNPLLVFLNVPPDF